MKHLDDRHARYLSQLVELAELTVPSGAQRTLLEHLDWVLEQNRFLNLTSITDPFSAVRLHVLDSLMVLPEVVSAPRGRLLDLGTGAGFPGFPLAVVANREAMLLDSVSKKVTSLGEFLASQQLAQVVVAQAGRAEELAVLCPSGFAVVTARAVSALPSLVELATPVLGQGGTLIAMKGQIEEEEIRRGDEAAGLLGMERVGLRQYLLPEGGEARTVVTFRSSGERGVSVPRRVGMAQRKPLA